MNFVTHIAMSEILYKRLSAKMELDKGAFTYGNVKPDLSKKILKHPHTLENFLPFVCNTSEELIKNLVSLSEFSFKLGEICHYICDFFCLYHTEDEIFHRLKEHFFYELKLHFTLLKIDSTIEDMREKTVEKSISSIINELRAEYFQQEASMEKDFKYAFTATTWVCQYIYYFSHHSIVVDTEHKMDVFYSPSTLPFAGGQ